MKNLKYLLFLLLCVIGFQQAEAHLPVNRKVNRPLNQQVTNRDGDCAVGQAQTDMAINNVRARILSRGDFWWNYDNASYVVPKPSNPEDPEVSSIFAGAVWLGGKDPAGNLKLACQDYGNGGATDFYPGPLDPGGTTSKERCKQWDTHFRVLGESIRLHIARYLASPTGELQPDQIPEDVRGWPARGNNFFFDIHGFGLPDNQQGLAPFFEDPEGDHFNGRYEPEYGEFPIIQVRGCEPATIDDAQFGDEMIFQIYNDAGGPHTQTGTDDPIRMEVQVEAFAYASNDQLNNMTFMRYKLINRAIETLDSCYFAMWVDPDLGCPFDDYVGCDTTVVKGKPRNLMYIYNQDELDGSVQCNCADGGGGQITTYCDKIPMLGVDYFRGPLDENGNELGMSSFTYYFGQGAPNPNMADPGAGQTQQYYNYLTGRWRDGSPYTFGGYGYGGTGVATKFAFPSPPDENGGWSFCQENLAPGDVRTIQASGPLTLRPGAINELIIGVVWVPDQDYSSCPSIDEITNADDLSQDIFDVCFDILDGPDAPDAEFIELDKELVILLSNDTLVSNNKFADYKEVIIPNPAVNADTFYEFQGYKVYQVSDASISYDQSSLDDPSRFRLIAQVDLKDSIEVLYNWTGIKNPNDDQPIWVPEPKLVKPANGGIRHSFQVTEDQFASGDDKRLINHKEYYFLTIAYSYNNYIPFNVNDPNAGQPRTYLEGRRNIGPNGDSKPYVATPRPIAYQLLGSEYGDGPVITRVKGIGVGGKSVLLDEETKTSILNGTNNGELTYVPGNGPLDISVYNPIEVKDGDFELSIVDANMNDGIIDLNTADWVLKVTSDPSQPEIRSQQGIANLNEQLIVKYGFAVNVGQTDDAGEIADDSNGFISQTIEYDNLNARPWMSGIADGDFIFDFVKTAQEEVYNSRDPKQGFTSLEQIFVPYRLCGSDVTDENLYLTPAWKTTGNNLNANVGTADANKLRTLNNVDIVFTSDKSLWSRCAIVETGATPQFNNLGFEAEGTGVKNFHLRQSPSVSKEDSNNDGKPDADNSGTIGMGWFPGYAIDVETGQRLNVFFGENSGYQCVIGGVQNLCENGAYTDGIATGRDMMFNPSSQQFLGVTSGLPSFIMGGQHFVYVTNEKYDECEAIRARLLDAQTSDTKKISVMNKITWTSMLMSLPSAKMKSYNEGLIPSDLTVRLRVDNPYQTIKNADDVNEYPQYRFSFKGVQAKDVQSTEEADSALDQIGVVPNPYYAYSEYETSDLETSVKLTNLPAKCVVTIYSLDGKFIRQYNRDEQLGTPSANNAGILNTQIFPNLIWDLKNSKGIPIGSGVYLIHVNAPGLGERVIKWFGVNRKFAPSRF